MHPIRPPFVAGLALAAATLLPPLAARADDAARQADVARRGAAVMPFDLAATVHVFTKTAQGGVQQVLARDPADETQARQVRQHLQALRERFLAGDWSAPAAIHGQDMPGLAELRAAPAGAIAVTYREVPGGAELGYATDDLRLVDALHRWFDAQLADHGADAMAGPMPAGHANLPMHMHHPSPAAVAPSGPSAAASAP